MHPDRHIIYQTAIQRMVAQALEEKEVAFQAEHAGDTDEALIQYLCTCAQELGHTPYPREIVGGQYLLQRFETWEKALSLAKLRRPTTPNKASAFALVTEETQRQEELYRQRKALKMQKHQQRLQKQAQAQKQYRQEQTTK